jgi:signal transduction histidine kinase
MTTLQHIEAVRDELLRLHKQLIDLARAERERVDGRIAPADFLRLLIEDAAFAWLQPMTALIVRIDEWTDDDERSPEVATAWLEEVTRLLSPSPAMHAFHERYAQILQDHPEIVLGQGRVMRAVRAVTSPGS